jgi:GNAT superfamily N-acetyltransferase
MTTIKLMENDTDIMSCFYVLKQLRTHLEVETFLDTIHTLQKNYNYQLLAVIPDNEVKAVAGYRIAESLAWGKYMYVDDLITDEKSRASGYAKLLVSWLEGEARKQDCEQFHLDSAAGPHRYDAHRFYLKNKMDITAHHFQKSL